MTSRSLQAWFIHKQSTGDTSVRVHIFTSELGLVQGLYRGGRAPKKQALLQPFTPLWVSLDERHNHYYIQAVEHDGPTLPLVGGALFSAMYLNELIHYILKPLAPELELFEAYGFVLQHLTLAKNKEHIESLLRRFEWSLLQVCGQSFSLTHDAQSGQLISKEKHYRFVAGKGMLVAEKGILGAHLLALAADDLTQADYLQSAKILMRQAIDHLLGGREIKSRSFFALKSTHLE